MRKLKLIEKKLNDVQDHVEKLEKAQESLDDDVFCNRKNITDLDDRGRRQNKEIEDLIIGRQGVDEWLLRCEKKMKELERKQKRYFEILQGFEKNLDSAMARVMLIEGQRELKNAPIIKQKNDGLKWFETTSGWMRANKAAEKYGVNPKTLYGLVRKGKLKKRKFEDNSVWVLEDEVKRYSEFKRLGS